MRYSSVALRSTNSPPPDVLEESRRPATAGVAADVPRISRRYVRTGNTIVVLALISFTFCVRATADPILGMATPGNFERSVGSYQFLSQEFVLTDHVQIGFIDIFMSGFGSDLFTFWLTDEVGAEASPKDVLVSTNVVFPDTGGPEAYDENGNAYISGQWISLSAGISLDPGEYFIVLSSRQVTPIGDGWVGALPSSEIPSLFGSVGLAGHATPPFGSINQRFPPASIFEGGSEPPFLFDLRSVPEPPAVLLLGAALLLVMRGLLAIRVGHSSTVK